MPPARTESAREARKAFHCDLCGKGYSRIHEFEAHENSYDHQHKKRFMEMKAMQRATTRVPKRDDGDGGVKKLEVSSPAGKPKAGFKKVGFRSAFGDEKAKVKVHVEEEVAKPAAAAEAEVEVVETDSEDDAVRGWVRYDPDRPTD
ncbi:hypothetical protein EDC01DRAFT_622140 [Geopyxis carbonaria]|nr:hypothetical protein EDC01DRAFT_622140 [Geopyxis carbonaria]